MHKSPKAAGTAGKQQPLSTPNVRERKEPKKKRSWGYISEPSTIPAEAPEAVAAPEVTKAVPEVAKEATPRKRKGRTLTQIMDSHKRSDGKIGFTFRDLCPKLHLAAESLRAAKKDPGRLSVNAVLALAKLMEEDPHVVMRDIMAEAQRSSKGKKEEAAKIARVGKPVPAKKAKTEVQTD